MTMVSCWLVTDTAGRLQAAQHEALNCAIRLNLIRGV